MHRRTWDAHTKAKIVLQGLQGRDVRLGEESLSTQRQVEHALQGRQLSVDFGVRDALLLPPLDKDAYPICGDLTGTNASKEAC